MIILLRINFCFMYKVIILVTRTTKGIFFPFYYNHVYFTSAFTLLCPASTIKLFSVCHFPFRKSFEIKGNLVSQILFYSLFQLKSNSKSSHQPWLWRNYYFSSNKVSHCKWNCFVIANPTLHENLFANRSLPFYPIYVIHAN